MTRKPLQLLIALACSTPLNAVALGVGQIQVRSALHQVLDAEIPLLLAGPGEAAGITAKLAPAQAFAQKGIDRLPVLSSLVFSVQTGADGRGLIRVTSKQPIREPLLNFLIQVDWPKGQVVREVAVLLDPPVKTKQRPAMPAPAMPALAQSAAPSVKPPRQPAAPNPPPSAPPPPPVAHRGTATYGPVPFGETLWSIASRVRPDPAVSVPRMMQALLAANPKAFWKPNVNGLRAGAQLRIPSAQEIDPQRFSEEVSRQLAGRQQVPVVAVAPRPASPSGGEPKVRLVSPELAERPQQPSPGVSANPPERVAPAPASASSLPIKLDKDNHPALRVAGLEELRQRISTQRPGEDNTTAAPLPPVAAVQPMETRQSRPEVPLPPATSSAQPEPRLQEILPETMAPAGTSKETGVGPTLAATTTPPASIPPIATIPPPVPKVLPPVSVTPAAPVPSPVSMPESQTPIKRFPPAVESETGGILKNWLNPASLAFLGGLGLLFGGFWYWWQHRARVEAGKEEALAFEETVSTGITATAGPTDKPDFEAGRKAVPAGGRRIARTITNPLERADLLLAVGNYSEAKNLLRQALQEEPDNNALRAKLLDVHFANQDAEAFLQEAKVLYESLEDKADPLWLPVAQQGQKLYPGHELFNQRDELLIATKTIKANLTELERPAKANGIRSGSPADEQVETTLFNALNEPTLVTDGQRRDNLAELDWQLTDVNKPTITTGTFSRPSTPPFRPKPADAGADRLSLITAPLAESPTQPRTQPKPEDTGADRLSLIPEPLTAPPTQPRTGPKSADINTDKLSLTVGFLAEPPTQPRTQPKPEDTGADRLSLIPEPLTAPPTQPRTGPKSADTDTDKLRLTAGFFPDPLTQPKTGVEKTRIERELEWRLKDLEQPVLNMPSSPVRTEEKEKSTMVPSSGLDFDIDSGFAHKMSGSRPSVAMVKGEAEREMRTLGPTQQPTRGLRESPRDREDTLRTEAPTTRGGVRILMGEDYTETKLDLAMAYLEMGDPVGAHSLLEEVLQEGNEDQRQRARGYLEKIGLL